MSYISIILILGAETVYSWPSEVDSRAILHYTCMTAYIHVC